jgi:hypothetical protein
MQGVYPIHLVIKLIYSDYSRALSNWFYYKVNY